jgi:hypothetical protein
MEFTDQGLDLTKREATDLYNVFRVVLGLSPRFCSHDEADAHTEEENAVAAQMARLVSPWLDSAGFEPEGNIVVDAEHYTPMQRVAELALSHSQIVVKDLCTPNICDGYRSERRPAAYRILALTAEVAEGIAWQERRLPQ